MRKLFTILLSFGLLIPISAFALEKNVASQKWVIFCFDVTDNTAKTGDAAQITGNLRIDGAAANAIDDTNPSELEDGYYVFDITAAESNGDNIVICPASSTGDVQCIGCPMALWTTPPNFADIAITGTNGYVTVGTNNDKTGYTASTVSDKTGYSLTQSFPSNFADLAITGTNGYVTVGTNNDKTGYTASTVSDKTGYSLSQSFPANFADLAITGTNGYVTLAGSQSFDMTGNITGNLSGSVGSVTGTVGSVTGNVGGNVTGSVGSLASQAKIDVNDEVCDVLKTDTNGELAGVPSATPTFQDILMWWYMGGKPRNKTQTYSSGGSGEFRVTNDAGTVISESDLSDDGSTFETSKFGAPD